MSAGGGKAGGGKSGGGSLARTLSATDYDFFKSKVGLEDWLALVRVGTTDQARDFEATYVPSMVESRINLSQGKFKYCETMAKDGSCDYGDNCRYSHHPSLLHQAKKKHNHILWKTDMNYQLWALKWSSENSESAKAVDPAENEKIKANRELFKAVLNKPHSLLKPVVQAYTQHQLEMEMAKKAADRRAREDKEEEKRGRDLEAAMKMADELQKRAASEREENKQKLAAALNSLVKEFDLYAGLDFSALSSERLQQVEDDLCELPAVLRPGSGLEFSRFIQCLDIDVGPTHVPAIIKVASKLNATLTLVRTRVLYADKLDTQRKAESKVRKLKEDQSEPSFDDSLETFRKEFYDDFRPDPPAAPPALLSPVPTPPAAPGRNVADVISASLPISTLPPPARSVSSLGAFLLDLSRKEDGTTTVTAEQVAAVLQYLSTAHEIDDVDTLRRCWAEDEVKDGLKAALKESGVKTATSFRITDGITTLSENHVAPPLRSAPAAIPPFEDVSGASQSPLAPAASALVPMDGLAPAAEEAVRAEDWGYLRRTRCQHLLDQVVHPFLIELFEIAWKLSEEYCTCGGHHAFKYLPMQHISTICSPLYDKSQLFRAIQQASVDSTAASLRSYFDVIAMCELLEKWALHAHYKSVYETHRKYLFQGISSGPPSGELYKIFQHWRHRVYHYLELNEMELSQCFKDVSDLLLGLRKRIMPLLETRGWAIPARWPAMQDLERKIEVASQAFSTHEALHKQAIRNAVKDIQTLGYQNFLRHTTSPLFEKAPAAREVCQLLCEPASASGVHSILLIPTLEVAGREKDKFAFLTTIPFSMVVSLNGGKPFGGSPLWTFDELKEGRCFRGQVRDKLDPTEILPQTVTLYTNDWYSVVAKEQASRIVIFVAVLGPYTRGLALDRLSAAVCGLRDLGPEGRARFSSVTFVPIFEDPQFVRDTKGLWEGEHDEVVALTEERCMDMVRRCIQNADLLAAMVESKMKRSDQTFMLNSYAKQASLAFSFTMLREFRDQVEVLYVGCDKSPPGRASDPDIYAELGLDGDQEPSPEVISRVVTSELQAFLKIGEASWFLFKHDALVLRDVMRELEDAMYGVRTEGKRPKRVFLVHGFGGGGTTLARHALYRARRTCVCIVFRGKATTSASLIDAFKKLLVNFNTLTGDHVMVLLDDYEVISQCPPLAGLLNSGLNDVTFLVPIKRTGNRNEDIRPEEAEVMLPDVSDIERDRFGEVIARAITHSGPVVLDNIDFPTDNFGFLIMGRLLDREGKLFDKYRIPLNKRSDTELIQAGFKLLDVIVLRHNDQAVNFDEYSSSRLAAQFTEKPSSQGLAMYGLLAFFPEFREVVRNRVSKVFEFMSEGDRQLLKLCTFLQIFSPRKLVPTEVAQVMKARIVPHAADQAFELSGFLLEFVAHDRDPQNGGLYIRSTNLAYVLAEVIFGSERTVNVNKDLVVSYTKMRDYLVKEVLDWLNTLSEDERRRLCRVLGPGLSDAFCYFTTWHPGSPPKGFDKMKNSYLVTILMLCERRDLAFLNAKKIFLKVRELYLELARENGWDQHNFVGSMSHKFEVFTTHAARFIAFEGKHAAREENIAEALRLVEEYIALCPDQSPTFHVYHALGDIYKRHVQCKEKIFQAAVKKADQGLGGEPSTQVAGGGGASNTVDAVDAPAEPDTDSDDDESSDDDDEYPQQQPQQQPQPADPEGPSGEDDDAAGAFIGVERRGKRNNRRPPALARAASAEAVAAAKSMHFLTGQSAHNFSLAIGSNKCETYPMIGCVQVWICLLKFIFRYICGENASLFAQYLANPKNARLAPLLPDAVKLFESIAQERVVEKCCVLLDKAKLSLRYLSKAMPHVVKGTRDYIKRCAADLDRLLGRIDLFSDGPVSFDISTVNRLLVSSPSKEGCLYAMYATFDLIFSREVGATSPELDKDRMDSALSGFFEASSLLSYVHKDAQLGQLSDKLRRLMVSPATAQPFSQRWRLIKSREFRGRLESWADRTAPRARGGAEEAERQQVAAGALAVNRSYTGLQALFALVAHDLWTALHVASESGSEDQCEVAQHALRESISRMAEFSNGSMYQRKTKFIMGHGCNISDNPFSSFVQPDEIQRLVEVKDYKRRELLFVELAREGGGPFKSFRGTYRVGDDPTKPGRLIKLGLLPMVTVFMQWEIDVSTFRDGEEVEFLLGLSAASLVAHGVRKV